MSDDDDLRQFRRFLRSLLDAILGLLEGLFDNDHPLRLSIVPFDQEGNPMTTAPPSPFPLNDDQSLPLGLALEGSNPNNLTIASVVWSATGTVGVTPAADTLTAEATTTPGTEGDGTVDVTATLSDGSTLTASLALVVSATPVPLSLSIVPGTPTP